MVLIPSLYFHPGATALHLAIAYGNDELAQEIVGVSNENAINALLKTVARGSYLYKFLLIIHCIV